jgi:allantoicase
MGALFTENEVDWSTQKDEDMSWTPVLSRMKLGPHRQHYFQLENVDGRMYTHVKVTIHPDGGIKRIRIIGRRIAGNPHTDIPAESSSETSSRINIPSAVAKTVNVPVLPLTPEAFATFGQVIQAYRDHAAVPKGTKVTSANGGTATKFHKLSLLDANYPQGSGATSGISVYRCEPVKDISADGTVGLTALERHPFTNQAFLPMGHGGGEGVGDPGDGYLVVVAQNGADDRPDMQTLRAFRASTAQGIVYKTGVWRKL